MSTLDSLIVIFTPSLRGFGGGVLVFGGFEDEAAADTWIQLQQDSVNGLCGSFAIDWITAPFTPKPDSHFALDERICNVSIQVGERVMESTPKIRESILGLKSVKASSRMVTEDYNVGLMSFGVFGMEWRDLSKMSRVLLQVPDKDESQTYFDINIPFADQ